MQELSRDQALSILEQRARAHDDLIEYAQLIDIPGVPLDADEDRWSIVETPLADHHTLTLHALQAMVDGRLMCDPETLRPLTMPTPHGLVWWILRRRQARE